MIHVDPTPAREGAEKVVRSLDEVRDRASGVFMTAETGAEVFPVTAVEMILDLRRDRPDSEPPAMGAGLLALRLDVEYPDPHGLAADQTFTIEHDGWRYHTVPVTIVSEHRVVFELSRAELRVRI